MPIDPLRIHLLEPFFGGSHAQWARNLQSHSAHQIDIFSLPAHYWKWRMHGGAITLAGRWMEQEQIPDLLLATDMLDLTTFLALTRERTGGVRTAMYFHENQMSYPWQASDRDVVHQRNHHYSFINYASALAADRVFFNSRYHLENFFEELPRLLKGFPDYPNLPTVTELREKSSVLALGVDLTALDVIDPPKKSGKPLVLWNHRWEHDKNPEGFFAALDALCDRNIDFEVAVLGEQYHRVPEVFEAAKERLGDRVVHWGFADSKEAYARWLWRADVIPVTSRQDFFGISLVEAMYCGVYPLVPDRLAFPEHFPRGQSDQFMYKDEGELVEKLSVLLSDIELVRGQSQQQLVGSYRWEEAAPIYDKVLSSW